MVVAFTRGDGVAYELDIELVHPIVPEVGAEVAGGEGSNRGTYVVLSIFCRLFLQRCQLSCRSRDVQVMLAKAEPSRRWQRVRRQEGEGGR